MRLCVPLGWPCRPITRSEFLRQIKEIEMFKDNDHNSLLASATAGKSAAVLNAVMDCVDHDLSAQEVRVTTMATRLCQSVPR